MVEELRGGVVVRGEPRGEVVAVELAERGELRGEVVVVELVEDELEEAEGLLLVVVEERLLVAVAELRELDSEFQRASRQELPIAFVGHFERLEAQAID